MPVRRVSIWSDIRCVRRRKRNRGSKENKEKEEEKETSAR
jgi:hypothetical protein